LYKFRALDACSFGDEIAKYGSSFYDLNSVYDIIAPIISSILFQVCSNNPNSFLQRCVEDIKPEVNMREVRNSIMHGTFFYDRFHTLVFYDSKDKDETNLKHVGTLTFTDIKNLLINVNNLKFKNSDNNLYNMGSDEVPYPHIVDFENEFLKS